MQTRRNPTSEEQWAHDAGVEYGEAVAEHVDFDAKAAEKYVRDHWKDDLAEEAEQIANMQNVDRKNLAKTLHEGVLAGLRAAIEAHEAEIVEEAPVAAPPPPPRREGVIDLGYEVEPHVKPKRPSTPPTPASYHVVGHKPPIVKRPWNKRAAASIVGPIRSASSWLEGWSMAANPPTHLWQRALTEISFRRPQDFTEWMTRQAIDPGIVIFALAQTAFGTFAQISDKMPDEAILNDTLDLVLSSNHVPSLKRRFDFHEVRASRYPCEIATRIILLAAIFRLEGRTPREIIQCSTTALNTLAMCVDSFPWVEDIMKRQLLKAAANTPEFVSRGNEKEKTQNQAKRPMLRVRSRIRTS